MENGVMLETDCSHEATSSHLDFIKWVRSTSSYILRIFFNLLSQETPWMSRVRGTGAGVGSSSCQERSHLVRDYKRSPFW